MLNWKILGNPINWVTVVLVMMIAGTAFNLLSDYLAPTATE